MIVLPSNAAFTSCYTSSLPGLFVLGEPTHDRTDLDDKHRALPDPSRVKAYIIPAGMGLILKKGAWSDGRYKYLVAKQIA